MNNGLSKNSAGLQKGGARRPDALMGMVYRRPSANSMCARLIFVVLAAFSSLHAQNIGIYVNSSNNVGIGTTSPLTTIDVAGTLRLDNPTTQANYFATLSPRYDSSHPFSLSVENNTGGTAAEVLGVYSPGGGGSLNLALGLHGNVGIGTTSPQNKLVISSDTRFFSQLEINDTRPAAQDTGGQILFSGNTNGTGSSGDFAFIFGAKENATASSYQGYLAFYTNTTGAVPGGVAEKMRITSSGNVGIGTTSPLSKLQVGGYGAWGSLPTNTQLYIPGIQQSDGSVANSIAMGVDVNANATMAITTRATTGDLYPIFMDIRSANVPVATFSSGGNVGIGTTNPGYKLDVNGQVHAASFLASSGNNYADFVFKPGYKLEPLSDVEASIKKDGHLPGIPSEAEAKAHGIDLASMQVKLLQKIEELTLHQIDEEKDQIEQEKHQVEQDKRIEQLEKENAELREKVTK